MIVLEFRIPLPIKFSDINVAFREMTCEATEEVTGNNQGCLWKVHDKYDNTDGHIKVAQNDGYPLNKTKGYRDEREYHVAGMCPPMIKKLLANNDIVLFEETYNGEYNMQSMNTFSLFPQNQLSLYIETKFTEKADLSDNIFNLNEKELNERIIFNVDLYEETKLKKICDMSTFHSEKQNKGPFEKDWMNTEPDMCYFYRVVKIDINIFGVSHIISSFIKNQQIIFTKQVCLQMIKYMDTWTGMTQDDVEKKENDLRDQLAQLMKKSKSYNVFMDSVQV